MKRTLCTLLLALMVALPISVLAQDQPTTTAPVEAEAEERDNLELSFHGGLTLPTGGIKDYSDSLGAKLGFNGGLDFGVFVKQNIAVGASFSYHQFGIDNENPLITQKHRIISPKAYVRYYFQGESDLVPYVKLHAGADFVNFSTQVEDEGTIKFRELAYSPVFAFGLGGGVFMYTSDYSGFFLEADYHLAMADKAEKDYKGATYVFGENYSLINLRAGIHLFFGSDE